MGNRHEWKEEKLKYLDSYEDKGTVYWVFETTFPFKSDTLSGLITVNKDKNHRMNLPLHVPPDGLSYYLEALEDEGRIEIGLEEAFTIEEITVMYEYDAIKHLKRHIAPAEDGYYWWRAHFADSRFYYPAVWETVLLEDGLVHFISHKTQPKDSEWMHAVGEWGSKIDSPPGDS